MKVTLELIDHFYKVHKVCPDLVEWKSNMKVNYENYTFEVNLVTEDEQLLEWFGWFTLKHGQRRWGFKILYRRNYIVRAWDMARQHYSNLEGRYIRGTGRHKHFYHSQANKRATYEIPEGEISIEDPNQALLDFCDECNIELIVGYQQKLFP